MTRKELKQYHSLKTEIVNLEKEIEKLRKRLDDVPEVMGKVTKSSDEFPHIEEHVSVEMVEPSAVAELNKRIRIKELRKDEASSWLLK